MLARKILDSIPLKEDKSNRFVENVATEKDVPNKLTMKFAINKIKRIFTSNAISCGIFKKDPRLNIKIPEIKTIIIPSTIEATNTELKYVFAFL